MWALRVPYEEYRVHCRACTKNVNFGSMGMQALKSHSKAMGHIKAMNNLRNQARVTSFFDKDSTTSFKTPSCTKAEVMWALHVVEQHSSFQSSEHLVELFKRMFPDSKLPSRMCLSPRKLSYILTDGIYVYIKEKIREALNGKKFSLGID